MYNASLQVNDFKRYHNISEVFLTKDLFMEWKHYKDEFVKKNLVSENMLVQFWQRKFEQRNLALVIPKNLYNDQI